MTMWYPRGLCMTRLFPVLFHAYNDIFFLFQDQEGYSTVRTNSAVHIKVYKKQLSKVASEGASKEVT